MNLLRNTIIGLAFVGLAACGGNKEAADSGEDIAQMLPNPYPSTYKPYAERPVLITGAVIYTGTGEKIDKGDIFLRDGKIELIGKTGSLKTPKGEIIKIDGTGKYVTPGIIDNHSHLGVYPSPGFASTSDGNEATSPNTAGVWAEHSVWPQDPGFTRALAGGITSLQILPGSANLFGGRAVTLKNVPSRTVQGMKFPNAPYGLKMACGENPKRVYQNSGPSTRMGNFEGYRKAWIAASAYKKEWDDYLAAPDESDPPQRDLTNETLAGALAGDILVNMHCYRADELAQVIDMSKEFGYKVTAFHHVVEGYKLADRLAEEGICASVWADWWGFKLEAYDSVRENAALIANQPNSCTIIHSDSAIGIQRLNQETAKAMADGRRLGIDIKPEQAITWITANPAKAMGILDQTGTLEVGKMADIVLWDGNPFSVYTHAEQVFIDGALMYDRNNPKLSPRMDFEIGQLDNATTGGAGQ
ncbi:MAG: amidohydrolase [bacterium]